MTSIIEQFITENNLVDSDTKKARQRLPISLEFLRENIPNEYRYEELKIYLETLKSRKNESYSEATIKDWINITRKFYNWKKGKEQMTIADTTTGAIENSQEVHSQQQPETKSKTKTGNVGRPKSTGRSEKFTLYLTPENMRNLDYLARYKRTSINELLNTMIDDYCTLKSSILSKYKEFEEEMQKLERSEHDG